MLVGDTHGNAPFMGRVLLLAKQAEVDLVVQVGDFGFWPGSGFASLQDDKFTKAGVPLWVIEGNHDYPVEARSYTAPTELQPGLRRLERGTVWEVDGVRFGFMGGAVSVDQGLRHEGRSWWSEEVNTEADVETAIQNGPVDVWITHDSVHLPPMRRKIDFGHRVNLAVALQQNKMERMFHAIRPRLHIHGHHHCRYTAPTIYGQVIGLDCESDAGIVVLDTAHYSGVSSE